MVKTSVFNFVKHFPEDNALMLYNTCSGASLILNNITSPIIINYLSTPGRIVNTNLPASMLRILTDYGFLIDENCDEIDILKKQYCEYIYDKSKLELTIIPTENCNFNCPYCFSYSKSPSIMQPSTFIKINKFISSKLETNSNNMNQLIINWFGGEPTLRAVDIINFMNNIIRIIDKNIHLYSTITTNGYLLNYDLFDRLLEAGISDFQITIDGLGETHNKFRHLKNGNPTFNTIYNNLLEIRNNHTGKNFKINIRCNFMKSNIDSLHKFLSRYMSDFANHDQFSIYFRPVYYYNTKSNNITALADDIFTLDEGISIQNQFAIKVSQLTGRNVERRIFDPLPAPTHAWCNADRLEHYIIGPNAEIYMCDILTGSENIVGYLDEDGYPIVNMKYLSWKYNIFYDDRTKKCIEHCRLLPICYGSCRRERLQKEAQCYWKEETILQSMETVYICSKM